MELSNYNGTTQYIRYCRKQKLNERIEIAKMEQQQATYENYTLTNDYGTTNRKERESKVIRHSLKKAISIDVFQYDPLNGFIQHIAKDRKHERIRLLSEYH